MKTTPYERLLYANWYYFERLRLYNERPTLSNKGKLNRALAFMRMMTNEALNSTGQLTLF